MERYETDGEIPSWNPFTPSEAGPIGVRSIGTTEITEVKVLPQHHPEEVKIILASLSIIGQLSLEIRKLQNRARQLRKTGIRPAG